MGKSFTRGDVVEVRSAAEILSTLDKEGRLEALPFMPEMLQYCGGRFVVERRAEKICDTIKYSGSIRLRNAVLLDDLRCDGAAHDGCQADCRIFWKESWLRRVESEKRSSLPQGTNNDYATLAKLTARNTRHTLDVGGREEVRYRCQATELLNASKRLKLWDPITYIREFTCGNVPFWKFFRLTAKAYVLEPLRYLGFIDPVPLKGTCTEQTPDEVIGLQPGDWVQVKSRDEIAVTLTPKGKTRGLWFDKEMLPYCGGTYRVRQRIKRFIHELDGRMVELQRECVTLEGVVCSGERSVRRWFCPRQIYPFWRETWLRRLSGGDAGSQLNRRRTR